MNDMRNLKTKDDALTLLTHLGYLAYDSLEERAFIPNNEIMGKFRRAMKAGGWENVIKVIADSESLLQNTLEGREDKVAVALDHAHMEIASNMDYNNEFGMGYADIVFLPLPGRNKPAIVVELNYNQTAQTAILQIKDKKYIDVVKDYTGDMILVGINYNKDKKEQGHSCKIERAKYPEDGK